MSKKATLEVVADIKTSILIAVDDEPMSIAALTSYFKSSGYETKAAWVLQAAQELAAEGKVKLKGSLKGALVCPIADNDPIPTLVGVAHPAKHGQPGHRCSGFCPGYRS